MIAARTASPLRYPGGKSCLLDLTADVLRLNGLERGHYAEPYAGGCGLALSLLYGGHVADIHINDIDPAIWAFWHSILENTEAFLGKVANTPVTIDEWRIQRDIYRQQDKSNPLLLGFSAFFLNRTNRSGIIKGGGVIGGVEQLGNYKIDCRYNVEDLSRRISRVTRYRESIHLTNLDALAFLAGIDKRIGSRALIFIDPPYFIKGSELYTSFYRPDDHGRLADRVLELRCPWIVTYDDNAAIRTLYRQRRQYCFDINYSISDKRVATEVMVASKGLRMPDWVRDRQVSRPQYRAA